MEELDVIYRNILHFGLLTIRNASESGHLEWCQIEADHLHNVPSLIGESNIHRHLYYAQSERPAYLQRMLSLNLDPSNQVLHFLHNRYVEEWEKLDKVLKID